MESDHSPRRDSVLIEEFENGCAILIPPRGIRGSGGWLFICATGASAVLFAALFGKLLLDNRAGAAGMVALVAVAVMGGGVYIVLDLSRRSAQLSVKDDSLAIVRRGVLGDENWRWQRNEIRDVRIVEYQQVPGDPTLVKHVAKYHPLYEKKFQIQVVPHHSGPVDLLADVLSEVSSQDQEEIISVIRKSLKLPSADMGGSDG